jgi:outer membrane protein OmpA-like peptidoglycan-associated protein/Tol biopolymer transport system component
MKKIYITLSFVLASGMLSAQNKDTKTADKLFDRYEYMEAAQEYLKLVEKEKADNYVYKQLADSYYTIFNTKEATKWFAKLVEEKQDAETYFKYAQMLKAQGNYEESDAQMQQFAAMAPKDSRAKAFLANQNYLPSIQEQTQLFTTIKLDINSDKSDFGAILANDNTLYFTSARNDSRKIYSLNDQPYLDLYKATFNANKTVSEATTIDALNTKWHDGPAAISADGNTMYFASESFNESKGFEKNKTEYQTLKKGRIYLYKATKQGDSWTSKKALPFNNVAYSVRNPSISKDGKTLYFSSDMPGGIGAEDIWKVSVDGDTYGTPENLGATVNTQGDDSFPFIADNDILYFSSNARQGLGGLDVYYVTLKENTEAVNVGLPVNSEKDDFSFSYNLDKKTAFFSSNRDGVDNIYVADPICGVTTIVLVRDATTGKFIENATVTMLEENSTLIGTKESSAKGEVSFKVVCDKAYSIQAAKQGYESGVFNMEKSEGGVVTIEATLNPILPVITDTEVVLQSIYFDFDKSNITEQGATELDKLVGVMNENPEMVIFAKSHTDARGKEKYNLNLSERRAKSTVQYLVSKGIAKARISGQGFGESELKVTCNTCTNEEHAQNRRSEFVLVKK